MPGKEIKGRSKRVMYNAGSSNPKKTMSKGQEKLDKMGDNNGKFDATKDFAAIRNKKNAGKRTTAMAGGMMRKKVMGGGSMMRMEKSMGGGLYENIKKKKDRIAAGSGEKMRKVGEKGAPTAQNFKDAAKTAKKA